MGLSRSQQMSRIRGKNTAPELLLRRALYAVGVRFRVHYRTPAGRADVAFPQQKLAVEVDGCFWHGCPEHYVRPRGSEHFWARKLEDNVRRDARQIEKMRASGWDVLRYWEHAVLEDPFAVAADVVRCLRGGRPKRQVLWRVLRATPLDPLGTEERRLLVDLSKPGRSRTIARSRHG